MQPGYRRVVDDIRADVAAGRLAPGDPLPSESELVARYGLSRGTVRQAFLALQADGVVTGRQGARRTVRHDPQLQSFADLRSFSRWATTVGETPGGQVVHGRWRAADADECRQLRLAQGSRIYHLTRVRTLSDRPVMVERTAYPERVGALVAGIDPATVSITERLAELGVLFSDAEHVIDAVAASAEDAALLGVRAGSPVLRERRTTTDPADCPVESSEDRYVGDAVAFVVRNSVAANALSRRAGSSRAG